MIDKKIMVVFGGSFNPPTNSHFSLAEQIISEYDIVEKVIFMPVNERYNKDGLISNIHRYNMLKLVIDKNDDFLLSRIELDQERQLDTIETLKIIQEEYSNYEIWFTVGTDNLKELDSWVEAEALVHNFKILVIERENDDMNQIISKSKLLKKYSDSFIKVKEGVRSNLSSTFVRSKLSKGKSIRYLTTEEIFKYISENNLYKY